MATGVVLAALGFWLIMRTVTKDDSGRTLVDRITGAGASAPSGDNSAGSGSTPKAPAGGPAGPKGPTGSAIHPGSGRTSQPNPMGSPR